MKTSVVWLHRQAQLTHQALEGALSPAETAFWLRRLKELQGRIAFEQRHLHEYEVEEG